MLNIEIYKSVLDGAVLDIAVMDGKACKCSEIDCQDCDFFNKKNCSVLVKEWLFEEYKVNWNEVEVDTPILVRNNKELRWNRRYFAGFKHGTIYAWKDGRTSWTACDASTWKYAKLAEGEE